MQEEFSASQKALFKKLKPIYVGTTPEEVLRNARITYKTRQLDETFDEFLNHEIEDYAKALAMIRKDPQSGVDENMDDLYQERLKKHNELEKTSEFKTLPGTGGKTRRRKTKTSRRRKTRARRTVK